MSSAESVIYESYQDWVETLDKEDIDWYRAMYKDLYRAYLQEVVEKEKNKDIRS